MFQRHSASAGDGREHCDIIPVEKQMVFLYCPTFAKYPPYRVRRDADCSNQLSYTSPFGT